MKRLFSFLHRNRKHSVIHRITLCFMLTSLFLVIIVFSYSMYTINSYNDSIYANQNTVLSFHSSNIEQSLTQIERFNAMLYTTSTDFRTLQSQQNALNAHLAGLNIIDTYNKNLSVFPLVAGFSLISESNQLERYTFNSSIIYEDRIKIQNGIRELLQDPAFPSQTWTTMESGNNIYAVCAYVNNGAMLITIIDFSLYFDLVATDTEAFAIVSPTGTLFGSSLFDQKNISISEQQPVIFEHDASTYSAVYTTIYRSDLSVAFISPYNTLPGSGNKAWIALLVLALIAVFSTFIIYLFIKRTVLHPLEIVINQIDIVRSGDFDTPLQTPSDSYEISLLCRSFNKLLTEIKHLKIRSYEMKLEKQHTQLQYLQLQLRPHFFLSQLKVLYGLAEKQQHQAVQERILLITDNVRAHFVDNLSLISLEQELKTVDSYLSLISDDLHFSIDIPANCRTHLVPPMLIQTFIENSIKYALSSSNPLQINVSCCLLEDEDFYCLKLCYTDNGIGYPESILVKYNNDQYLPSDDGHIGLSNLKHRILLLYGNEASSRLFNQNGACAEFFLPLLTEKRSDSNEYTFN